MKTFVVMILCCSLAVAGDCRVQVAQQAHVQQQFVAVGAIPLNQAYLLDTQAYQYRMNPTFNSHQEYLSIKSKSKVKTKVASSEVDNRAIALEVLNLMREQGIVTDGPVESAPPVVSAGPAAEVIEARCAKCHGPIDPKGDLILVDASGATLKSLPWKKIQGRVNSVDPDLRMPPKGLPSEELNQLNLFLKGKVK
jgi:hypothetical protein